MNNTTIGNYLSYLRKKRGFTQTKLGEIIGVSDKAISKWENGDGLPDVGTLPTLAIALNTSVDSILNGGPIKFTRLLNSLGAEDDIIKGKLLLVSFISMISAWISLKLLYAYVLVKELSFNENYFEMGFDQKLSIFPSSFLNAFITITIMFFSYFIYSYYKKKLTHKKLNTNNFFETIMSCIWIAPVIFILCYQISPIFNFVDLDLVIYIATVIYVGVSFKFINNFLKFDRIKKEQF